MSIINNIKQRVGIFVKEREELCIKRTKELNRRRTFNKKLKILTTVKVLDTAFGSHGAIGDTFIILGNTKTTVAGDCGLAGEGIVLKNIDNEVTWTVSYDALFEVIKQPPTSLFE